MPIRFKFRSSLNFDVLEIGDRPSISVKELRTNVLHGNVSQQRQQGFDLIFSDEASGLEYKDDDDEIPNGSNVIIKRVPTEIQPQSPVQVSKNPVVKESSNHNPDNGPMEEFDFGSDLFPTSDSKFPDFSSAFDNENFGLNKQSDAIGLRNLDNSQILGFNFQKIDSFRHTEAVQSGAGKFGNEHSTLRGINGKINLNKLPHSKDVLEKGINMPLDFKCSLCKSVFKHAVMIPCCQHSFCETCIRQVLIEKNRCPKCSSSKCSIRDLLPNVSLRQAIDHFFDSQMVDGDFGNSLQTDVPDGESNIQAKDVSPIKAQKVDQSDGWEASNRGTQAAHQEPNSVMEFQGENHPVTSRINSHEEGGHERNFVVPNGPRKGSRNCFGCGSTEHLVRECPIANPNPMFQPGNGVFNGGVMGYAPPFWNGPSMMPFRPYTNMYGGHPMMPFNVPIPPGMPFGVPPYMAPMHGGPVGNMGPQHPEDFELQHDSKRKCSDENESEQLSENKANSTSSPKRLHNHQSQKDMETTLSHSWDSTAQRSGRKSHKYLLSDVDDRDDRGNRTSVSGAEKRHSLAESSHSGREEPFRDSERDGEHSSHHKRNHENRDHRDDDSSFSRHSMHKDSKQRDQHDRSSHRSHDHHSSSHHRGEYKVSRGSTYDEKLLREKQWDHRRRRHHASDEDHRDEYRSNKRRAH